MSYTKVFIYGAFIFFIIGLALPFSLGIGLWADSLLLVLFGIGAKFYEVREEDKRNELEPEQIR